MIEECSIDGRRAAVACITRNWLLCRPDEAYYIKIIFDDGEEQFVTGPRYPAATGANLSG